MLKTLLAIDDEHAVVVDERAPPPLPIAERRAEYDARASLCRLLAGVFVEEADADFVRALRCPEVLASLAAAGVCFKPILDAEGALVERLACDTPPCSRPAVAPPVESVRLTGRYKQDPHFQVARTTRSGASSWARALRAVPDQLGVERCSSPTLSVTVGHSPPATSARPAHRARPQASGRSISRAGCAATPASRGSPSIPSPWHGRLPQGFAGEEIAAMGLRIDDESRPRRGPEEQIRVEFNPDEPVCNGCESIPDTQQRAANVLPCDLR